MEIKSMVEDHLKPSVTTVRDQKLTLLPALSLLFQQIDTELPVLAEKDMLSKIKTLLTLGF